MKTSLQKILSLFCLMALTSNAKEYKAESTKKNNTKAQIVGCPNSTAQLDLTVNNVRARILNGGDLWWNPIAQVNYYEVPIGSGKNSIYCGGLWIGGYDASNAIKVAAQTYRQQGANDFWPGPISKDVATDSLSISNARCAQFDRFWSLTKQEVQNFVSGGNPTQTIIDYPGNGNVANGELPFLAPFFDSNNDGVYDYTQGDYPLFNLSSSVTTGGCNDYLSGDQTIWWVFNDIANFHGESNSDPIGLEIRAQAFAFSSVNPNINNATFYKYQIINRSSELLSQCRIGFWTDVDLGDAADDYVGCDVMRGLGFCYNGDSDDNGSAGYGLNPPAVGTDFLHGPLADISDGIDNNMNGITDELGEDCIMSKFVYYQHGSGLPLTYPSTTDDYYQLLSGLRLDGLPITYGGNGYSIQTNPPCSYMFSGDLLGGSTDPGFSIDWNMASAGITPDDMRYLQSVGKFTLDPGEVDYLTIAAVWARDTAGPISSVIKLKAADDDAQALFNSCFTTVGIKENELITNVKCAPNPFTDKTFISFNNINHQSIKLQVYDLKGKLVRVMQTSGDSFLLESKELNSGVYLVRLLSDNKTLYSGKIIVQ